MSESIHTGTAPTRVTASRHVPTPVNGAHDRAIPMAGHAVVPFLTPGVWGLIVLAGIGLLALTVRFLFGIGTITNLDNQYPWGLWIGIDVATGVALAAGGVHDRLRRPRSAPAQVSRHRPAGPADSHARIHVRGAGRLC